MYITVYLFNCCIILCARLHVAISTVSDKVTLSICVYSINMSVATGVSLCVHTQTDIHIHTIHTYIHTL